MRPLIQGVCNWEMVNDVTVSCRLQVVDVCHSDGCSSAAAASRPKLMIMMKSLTASQNSSPVSCMMQVLLPVDI